MFLSTGPPAGMGGYAPPTSMKSGPPPPMMNNQLTNQMGAMNIQGGPPNSMAGSMPPPIRGQAGPPSSQPGPPMGPPTGMSGPTQMGNPPTSMPGQPRMPPSGVTPPVPYQQQPPQGMQPPTSQPPVSGFPGMPPPPGQSGMTRPPMPGQAGMPGMQPLSSAQSNMSGMPPPPGQPGMPPSSMAGMPPSSMAGMPPSSMPPSSMGGMPPPPGQIGMSAPGPQAMHGMPPLPGQGMPPQPGQMPPAGNQMAGMPPRPGMPPPPGGQPGMPPPPGGQPGMPPPPGAQPGMPPPPSPGYGAQPGGFPPAPRMGAPAQGGQMPGQPQQPRRLDPEQMPSPIQVIEDDKANRGGLFQTGQKGIVPPLITTSIIAEDQGNCNPRMMRSTMYNIPCTADMLKQSHVPFILNISPFARLHPKENPPPIVDLGEIGPVRCNRCKAYMSPYMQFIDGGRRFQCCFCSCTTDVPPEYFNHLDHTGRRVDTYDRPELCLGAYEFVATKDYCKNGKLPNIPAFIFMIDVSYNSVKSGLVHLLCSRIKEEILSNLPKENGAEESEIRVGFVTYAKQLHFYNVKSNLAQPQMLVVSDVQDVFVPLLDGFLVNPKESESVIDSLLEQIPAMFADNRETEIVLGPVIQAGLDALKSAECSGKLFIFHSSLPIADAPGRLKNRDDHKLLGTEKEKQVLMPANNFYTKLGEECVANGCGVDLFLFPNQYVDLATIAEVPRLTGGQIYKYTYFQADLDGQRFMDDLRSNVERPISFDAIMRVRTSTGIRPVDFLGNFYMSNTTDVELATMDCDKSVTCEIKHDDKLNEAEGAMIQCAILYTSVSGKRRLRILNFGLACCTQMADLFRNCELDTLVNHMAKVSMRENLKQNPRVVREALMNQCAQILACYRKNCASPSSVGQLILPECMKLLPLYTNCVIKSTVLQGGTEISTDDRSFLMHLVNAMPVKDTHAFFYPRLVQVNDLDVEATSIPTALRCSYERLKDTGAYLLENGLTMYLWIGLNVNPEWVQNVFGVQSAAQIDIDKTSLQDLDTPISRRLRGIVKKMREERRRHMKLIVVRQRDKLEPVFQQYLMEDRGINGSASYVDFLCHIHKEIRNLLS